MSGICTAHKEIVKGCKQCEIVVSIGTYEMEFICTNCGTYFIREIPKGQDARGKGGSCPYCGKEDSPWKPFINTKPKGYW